MGADRRRFPKRKVAMLLGYAGTRYQGMQFHAGTRTVEGALFAALAELGFISADNASHPSKVDWMRACRTDKGVHAAGQLVTVKMLLVPSAAGGDDTVDTTGADSKEEQEEGDAKYDFGNAVKRINAQLDKNGDSDIRLYSIQRCLGGFDSWKSCDSRWYEYCFPSYLIKPSPMVASPNHEPIPTSASCEQGGSDALSVPSDVQESSGEEEDKKTVYVSSEEDKRYRVDDATIDALNGRLRMFEGTHCFHNFTLGKDPKDPSSQRFIRRFLVHRRFYTDNDEIIHSEHREHTQEWISLRIHGQSFMLHQIRKMVALVVLSMRFGADFASVVAKAFDKDVRWNIPKVPGEGLFLERCLFDGYNLKLSRNEEYQRTADPIIFDDDALERTKHDLIYPAVLRGESHTGVFQRWLHGLLEHSNELHFLRQQ